ncbi:MAG: monovalent cation/H+ antiporter subunit D family protein, partial [Alphaproteobacteria bacterium]|nr:monovalent cation/H+ antiporter subunit D family protein [Alphaproteobacteria bacterium]
MIMTNIPGLIVVVPLLSAVIVALMPSGGVAWVLTLLATIATFALTVMNATTGDGATVSYALGGWPPPWGIEFISDGASRLMALIIASLSVASTLYANILIEKEIHEKDQARV